MKNVILKLKVRESENKTLYDFAIFEGRKMLMLNPDSWIQKKSAIKNAKAMAKRIGIKYDPEIIKIKQHRC